MPTTLLLATPDLKTYWHPRIYYKNFINPHNLNYFNMFNTPPMWRVSMICPRRITLAPTPSYLINSFCVWGTIVWNDFWRSIQIPPNISNIFFQFFHHIIVSINKSYILVIEIWMHLQKLFQPIVAQSDPTCALLEQWVRDVNQNHVSPSLIGSYSKKHIVEQKTGKY